MAEETYRYWVSFNDWERSGEFALAGAFEFEYPLDTADHVYAAQQKIAETKGSHLVQILTWKRLD